MPHYPIALAGLVLAGTTLAGQFALPAHGSTILQPSQGAALLQQCSRGTPESVSHYWQPSAAEITVLESKLLPWIHQQRKSQSEANLPAPIAFNRQYIGIVVHGQKQIYGNFYPAAAAPDWLPAPATEPVIVCDGGNDYWGVVYTPQDGRFSQLQTNGVA